MNRTFSLRFVTALTLSLPALGLANLDQTLTLQANKALNFDTGATANAGLDILWNGASMAPQGNATAVVMYEDFPAGFYTTISPLTVQLFPGYAKTPITKVGIGTILGVRTNGGHYAKAMVTANSGGSITLRFTTYGVASNPNSGTGGPPTITAIKNNSSLISPGLPNYGIAPSSIFVIQGSGLADAGVPALQSSAAPGIPLTLNGASITVVVGGVTVHPALYYTSPTQLAAELPASTPVGTGTLTVIYKGVASNAAAIQVVPSALGINTYNGNTGVATDASSGALLTYTDSGKPGQIIVLWTTGLGSDPADSDTVYSPTPHAVATPLQMYVGGIPAQILYAGSAGYPGVDQINMILPDGAPDGCWISLAAVAGGVLSNVATLPIHRGGGACVDTLTGLTAAQITAGGKATIRTGLVGLIQTDSPGNQGGWTVLNSATAAFETYSGVYTPSNSVSPGSCIVNDLTPVSVDNTTGLEPGKLTLEGPAGLNATLTSQGIKGAYYATLGMTAITASGGTYTFAGAGGADVGAFTSTITLSNPLLTWTNQSAAATVDRTQPLTVTWSGGNPGSFVFITGTSATQAGVAGGFTCLAPASDGRFTVPAYILSALPAGNGGTELQNYVYGTLNPSGLDLGLAFADIAISTKSTYR